MVWGFRVWELEVSGFGLLAGLGLRVLGLGFGGLQVQGLGFGGVRFMGLGRKRVWGIRVWRPRV